VEASITNLAIKACIEGKDMFCLNIYWSPNNSPQPFSKLIPFYYGITLDSLKFGIIS
jgi:hypothetical protein